MLFENLLLARITIFSPPVASVTMDKNHDIFSNQITNLEGPFSRIFLL